MLTPLCFPPQILEFGLYEFVPTEDNPGGVRKMKAGTEVGTLAKPYKHRSSESLVTSSRPRMRLVHCQVASMSLAQSGIGRLPAHTTEQTARTISDANRDVGRRGRLVRQHAPCRQDMKRFGAGFVLHESLQKQQRHAADGALKERLKPELLNSPLLSRNSVEHLSWCCQSAVGLLSVCCQSAVGLLSQALKEWYEREGPKLTKLLEERVSQKGDPMPVKSQAERRRLEEFREREFLKSQGVAEKDLPGLTSQNVRVSFQRT